MLIQKLNAFRRDPMFVVFIYALFGFLWITYSDLLLETLVSDVETLSRIQTWKGWLFIGVTSALLYLLVHRNIVHNIRYIQEQKKFMVSAPIPLLILEESGDISLVNEAFVEVYGYTLEDIPHANQWWEKAYPDPEYRAKVFEQWREDAHGANIEIDQAERVFTVIDKSGTAHDVRFVIILQEKSRIIVCQDISKQVLWEKQMRQSEKMTALGQLAGGVAHDFNNQLGVITGYLGIIDSFSDIGGKNRESFDAIIEAVNVSKELTSQLLMFSRDEKVEFHSIDMDELLMSVIKIIQRTFPKSIRIETEINSGGCKVNGNFSQLQNALLNLAINARDAMEDGGLCTIRSCSTEEEMRIVIEDSGAGIDEEVLPHIFEPFYTTKSAERGTGLGLAAVYGTIENHGGAIEVESVKGSGTVFTVVLQCSFRA